MSVEELERDILRLTQLQFVASKLLVKIVASVDADLGEHGDTGLQVRRRLTGYNITRSSWVGVQCKFSYCTASLWDKHGFEEHAT